MPAPIDALFWRAVAERANADPVFIERTSHLEGCTLRISVDDAPLFIEFHRSRATVLGTSFVRGARISISGPAAEWEKLVDGTYHYMRAINPLHGGLRLEGDALMANWAARGLCAFMDIAVALRTSGKGIDHA